MKPDNLNDILDTDWLCCTDDDNVTYKVRGSAFKDLFAEYDPPWTNPKYGSVWHLITTSSTSFQPNWFSDHPEWDLYEVTSKELIDNIDQPGEYILAVQDVKDGELFKEQPGTWDFGPLTNSSKHKNWSYFLDDSMMFRGDVQHLDTSSATTFRNAFTRLMYWEGGDLSHFNTSNCVDMSHMFEQCYKFQGKGLRDWDVSNVVTFESTFEHCTVMDYIDVGKWNTKSAEDMVGMFMDCGSVFIDIPYWCVPHILTEPINFRTNSYNVYPPVWGTCPRGEDQ